MNRALTVSAWLAFALILAGARPAAAQATSSTPPTTTSVPAGCACSCGGAIGVDIEGGGVPLVAGQAAAFRPRFGGAACAPGCPARTEASFILTFIPAAGGAVVHVKSDAAPVSFVPPRPGRLIVQVNARRLCGEGTCRCATASARREFEVVAPAPPVRIADAAPAAPAPVGPLSLEELRRAHAQLLPSGAGPCPEGDAAYREAEEANAAWWRLFGDFSTAHGRASRARRAGDARGAAAAREEVEALERQMSPLRDRKNAALARATKAYRRCFWASHPLPSGTRYAQNIPLPSGCKAIAGVTVASEDALTLSSFYDPARPMRPGERRTDSSRFLDRASEIRYGLGRDEQGRPRLEIATAYLNRFHFRVTCLDEAGKRVETNVQCPGSLRGDGSAVEYNSCEGPYFGRPRIIICGVDARRLGGDGDKTSAVVDILRRAVATSGGYFWGSTLAAAWDAAGRTYTYLEGTVTELDVCAKTYATKLEGLARLLGAEIEVRGTLVVLRGKDAGGACPVPPFLGGLRAPR